MKVLPQAEARKIDGNLIVYGNGVSTIETDLGYTYKVIERVYEDGMSLILS